MQNGIKAVLFDLDGTLLPMDDLVKFMKTYFELLSNKLSDYGIEGKRFFDATMRSMKEMAQNTSKRTNADIFWKYFEEEFGYKETDVADKIEDFYKNEYRTLKSLTGYNPEINLAIKSIKEKGYRLAVATNPLFPAIALTQRLEWAGVDIDDFEFITTYEDYHSCKPSPNYYKEVAKNLNLSPSEIMMVGNDTSDDMSAVGAGMKVFLLTDCLINRKGADISIYPNGNIRDLLKILC